LNDANWTRLIVSPKNRGKMLKSFASPHSNDIQWIKALYFAHNNLFQAFTAHLPIRFFTTTKPTSCP